MFLLYDLIFLLYALIYLPYLLLTKRAYAGFGMRLGFLSSRVKKQIKAKTNIWLHAVSVGEVMVIDGFIDQLTKKYPAYQLVVTSTTKTGYMLACQRLQDKALVIPSPIDFSFVTGFFVSLIKPKIYIAVETEIWPNLYRQLSRHRVPLVVINGRISDRSFGRYKAVRFLLKNILNQVQLWCMQSPGDAQRIITLGAKAANVVVTGNVKFDHLPPQVIDPAISDFVNSIDKLWWIAGSTHPGEEEIVLDVYEKMVKDNPQWRLVIAPRHIERVAQIVEMITRRNLQAVKFSQLSSIALDIDAVIVLDTIGHLRSLYSLASLVFVGKSLCVGGGHNVIEPAFYGKAIVIGPRMENFRDIVACFKEGNAIMQVEDVPAFEAAVRLLCADKSKRESLGEAARRVIAANQGATKRSLEHLSRYVR